MISCSGILSSGSEGKTGSERFGYIAKLALWVPKYWSRMAWSIAVDSRRSVRIEVGSMLKWRPGTAGLFWKVDVNRPEKRLSYISLEKSSEYPFSLGFSESPEVEPTSALALNAGSVVLRSSGSVGKGKDDSGGASLSMSGAVVNVGSVSRELFDVCGDTLTSGEESGCVDEVDGKTVLTSGDEAASCKLLVLASVFEPMPGMFK